MTLAELRDRYNHIMFLPSEMTDPILTSVFRESVNYYNKFNPEVRVEQVMSNTKVYDFPLATSPDYIFRIYYTSLVFDNSAENLYTEWLYMKPTLYIIQGSWQIITGYNHKLESVDLDKHDLLDAYIKNKLIIACSDKRRMGSIADFPIDAKGDQFFGEAKSEVDRLESSIQMLAPIIY